jgi:hypothetical protein
MYFPQNLALKYVPSDKRYFFNYKLASVSDTNVAYTVICMEICKKSYYYCFGGSWLKISKAQDFPDESLDRCEIKLPCGILSLYSYIYRITDMYTKVGKKQQRTNFETSDHHNLW